MKLVRLAAPAASALLGIGVMLGGAAPTASAAPLAPGDGCSGGVLNYNATGPAMSMAGGRTTWTATADLTGCHVAQDPSITGARFVANAHSDSNCMDAVSGGVKDITDNATITWSNGETSEVAPGGVTTKPLTGPATISAMIVGGAFAGSTLQVKADYNLGAQAGTCMGPGVTGGTANVIEATVG